MLSFVSRVIAWLFQILSKAFRFAIAFAILTAISLKQYNTKFVNISTCCEQQTIVVNNALEKKVLIPLFVSTTSTAKLSEKSDNQTFRPVMCRYKVRVYSHAFWAADSRGEKFAWNNSSRTLQRWNNRTLRRWSADTEFVNISTFCEQQTIVLDNPLERKFWCTSALKQSGRQFYFFVSMTSTAELCEKSENRTFRPVTCRYRVRQYFDVLWAADNCGK